MVMSRIVFSRVLVYVICLATQTEVALLPNKHLIIGTWVAKLVARQKILNIMWLRRLFRRYHLNSVHCKLSDCLFKFSEKIWPESRRRFQFNRQVNKGFCEGLAKSG